MTCAAGPLDTWAAERTSDSTRIRPTARRLRDAVERGISRSLTFRELIDRLEESDVIVHIAPQLQRREGIAGELQFATVSGGARYLRVTVKVDLPMPELVAMIAHELQHAAEVAARPDVVDSASLEELYRTIGFPSGLRCHDTHAARSIGVRVLDEFTR